MRQEIMIFAKHINRGLVRAALLALLGCIAGYANIVTIPAGLTPGTQYQLAFVTADTFFVTSTTISEYNTDVTNEAALNAALATFDTANNVTWTVIGSTPTVNATANAPSTGLVYTLNGAGVASSASSLYSGALLSAIDIDQNGNSLSTRTWTGSTSVGTVSGGINDLGQTFPEFGNSSLTTGGWIASGNGEESDNRNSLYALSSVITVAGTSAVPEPRMIALMTGAVLLLVGISRLRRNSPGLQNR
jgi:hypothetical protein